MIMKTFAFSCFLIISLSMNIQAQNLNKSFFEEKVGYDILIDHCDRSGLEGPEFGKAFKEYYSAYKTNVKTLTELSKHIDGIKIKIIMGTWCHDSKIQVPCFIKILDQISFVSSDLEIICVDRSKQTHSFSIKELDVNYVPTFIFYKDEKEIGRIIESPEISLEKDFLEIVN